jgi:hypothetical protein
MVTGKGMLSVGIPIVIEGGSPSGMYSAVFEDDGETGYFYALARELKEFAIVDAVQVYVVASVVDCHTPVTTEIVWSSDAKKSALILNGLIYALFDFSTCRGYCCKSFPSTGARWSRPDWSDEVPAMFN